MIILDACVIRGMRLDGSDVDVLRAIVATGTEQVGAPSIAVEELAAQKALEYLEAHRVAVRALRQLALKSHRTEPKLEEPDAEGVREMWRRKYDFLQVLPTSGAAASEGLYREANVLPPATTKGDGNKKVKVGARDVAIWLTAVEYAREHPDETVYFVSSNHTDFTKGEGRYPAPMDNDVADLGNRFVHLTNLAELLKTLAPKVEIDAAEVHGLLEQHTEYIAYRFHGAWKIGIPTPFDIRTREGEVETAQSWVFPEQVRVRLVDIRDIEAYRLGATSWVVATARWEFVGLAIGKTLFQGACTREIRILFPTQLEDEHTPEFIKTGMVLPVENASAVDWPPMMRGWDYARHVFQAAEAEGRRLTEVETIMTMVRTLSLLLQNNELDLSAYPPYQPLQLTLPAAVPGVTEGEQPEAEE
ncbi:PIN domain-containing protein [Streptomyces scabiei]|uniref:PIN domain-containing protein n=1 Tax=Streptomyces scabiei TaxID=1930 RepID=UPI001B30E3F9|nr:MULTISPECIES: PIN domain-containing protein [Streptomyces]MBP5873177.1 hypothetical protein [Streptomyces sp. LBUM 1477]MBP5880858.1 hypothetical protein [Streptomyces sp. LBUM 1487]MBP5896611.1 hypothetical protein [Streptomyces sp. LBUM 1488]MDW8478536.1 PIN domain-containing protein [Streptomyces scabiei]MDX2570260.1 PIN domain-containing protein [Streptomyces scabiei]